MPRLQVNVDHVATLRQARRESFPDPVAWALEAERAGALGITAHLRVDRRHIQDDDIRRLRRGISTRLNFELSLDDDIVRIALRTRPEAACLVPENRKEITTEGGLDVVGERARLSKVVPQLTRAGCDVSLFIDPESEHIDAAAELGARFVELHTGSYANASGHARARELERLVRAAEHAHARGLRVNAGHGLDYDNVGPIARLPHVEELNIGFAIVARAVFTGVREAVERMAQLVHANAPRSTREERVSKDATRDVLRVASSAPRAAGKAPRSRAKPARPSARRAAKSSLVTRKPTKGARS